MTNPVSHARAMLPHQVPSCPYSRLLLFGIRRMAAGGLDDATASHAFFTGFGMGFRRPLILLRAFMAEAARVASTPLLVAPCCAGRATAAERSLLSAIARAPERPDLAHAELTRLFHVRDCLGLVTSAQAIAVSFHDHGMPLASDCV